MDKYQLNLVQTISFPVLVIIFWLLFGIEFEPFETMAAFLLFVIAGAFLDIRK